MGIYFLIIGSLLTLIFFVVMFYVGSDGYQKRRADKLNQSYVKNGISQLGFTLNSNDQLDYFSGKLNGHHCIFFVDTGSCNDTDEFGLRILISYRLIDAEKLISLHNDYHSFFFSSVLGLQRISFGYEHVDFLFPGWSIGIRKISQKLKMVAEVVLKENLLVNEQLELPKLIKKRDR